MKYYSIRIQNKLDGTEVRTIFPCETQDEAEIQFHKNLATDMGNADIKSVTCMVISQAGGAIMSRYWVAPTKVEEPVVEETTE